MIKNDSRLNMSELKDPRLSVPSKEQKNQASLSFTPLHVIKFLGSIVIALLILSLTVLSLKYFSDLDSILFTFMLKQFNFDLEGNIPTYFSALLLLVASLILYFIYKTSQYKTNYWLFLTALFIFLSIDELIQIHEKFNMIRPQFEILRSGALKYVWVFPYVIFLLVLGLSLKRFLFRLPVKTRNWFILSAVVFVGGAMGIEVLHDYLRVSNGGNTNFYLELLVILEEICEMIGTIIFIYALLDYILPKNSPLTISCER